MVTMGLAPGGGLAVCWFWWIEGRFHPHPNLPPSRGKGFWLLLLASRGGRGLGWLGDGDDGAFVGGFAYLFVAFVCLDAVGEAVAVYVGEYGVDPDCLADVGWGYVAEFVNGVADAGVAFGEVGVGGADGGVFHEAEKMRGGEDVGAFCPHAVGGEVGCDFDFEGGFLAGGDVLHHGWGLLSVMVGL